MRSSPDLRTHTWRLLASVLCIIGPTASGAADFVLTSPDSRLVVSVPEKYTAKAFGCSGGNVSPALSWHGAPAGTRSFVLTLFDPDEERRLKQLFDTLFRPR